MCTWLKKRHRGLGTQLRQSSECRISWLFDFFFFSHPLIILMLWFFIILFLFFFSQDIVGHLCVHVLTSFFFILVIIKRDAFAFFFFFTEERCICYLITIKLQSSKLLFFYNLNWINQNLLICSIIVQLWIYF